MSIKKIQRRTKSEIKSFLSSIWTIVTRYKYHLLATILFIIILNLVFYFEHFSKEGISYTENYFDEFTGALTGNKPSWVSYQDTKISYILITISPAILVGVILTAGSRLIKDLVGEEREKVQSATRSKSIIDSSKNHVIIAGMGRLGQQLSKLLYDAGLTVIGIDKNPEKVNFPVEGQPYGWMKFPKRVKQEKAQDYTEKIPGLLAVEADDLTALERANVDKALVLCLMSTNFDSNMLTLMGAKAEHENLRIIVRANNEEEIIIYNSLNIISIEPKSLGAEEIIHLLKTSLSEIKKFYGYVAQENISLLLHELETNKFNIEKYRRWQAFPELSFVQLTIKNPDIQDEHMRDKLNEIKKKYIVRLRQVLKNN